MNIKKFVNDHKIEIRNYTIAAVGGITLYTFLCKGMGYRMVKPIGVIGDFFEVEGVTGKTFKTYLNP